MTIKGSANRSSVAALFRYESSSIRLYLVSRARLCVICLSLLASFPVMAQDPTPTPVCDECFESVKGELQSVRRVIVIIGGCFAAILLLRLVFRHH